MKKHDTRTEQRHGSHPQAKKPAASQSSPHDAPTGDHERTLCDRMTDQPAEHQRVGEVEGEGSYTATRRYREGLERSIRKGDTETLAEEALQALEGPEGEELEQAEKAAKRGRPATRREHSQPPH